MATSPGLPNLLDSKIFDKVIFGGAVGKVALVCIVVVVAELLLGGAAIFEVDPSARASTYIATLVSIFSTFALAVGAVLVYAHKHEHTAMLEGLDLLKHHQQMHGFGVVSEVPPGLAEVMRRNSESLEQALTTKARGSDLSRPTVD